ncbi:MAG TPA: tyrosine-type recombinase/integrase [Terriglobales bacterium]
MRWRRPPLQHPLAPVFAHAVASLCTALTAGSKRQYEFVVRSFLVYLGREYPAVTRLEQLRRDPHILGWMARLRANNPPLATTTCIGRLFALRTIFHELACTSHLAELAYLLLREDIPRSPHSLPRPLTPEQDQLLQQEFMRRNDLGGNVFLLLRHTGMRIGECVDLSYDCLRSTGPRQWTIHVPLGKLKTERMVPLDAFGRDLVHRLRFFRSLDPLPEDGRLLARPGSKVAILVQLRDYLHLVCHSLGLSTRIVPHQLRHTYATEMLRSGVSFPILMKLLGHVDPAMTMRYVDVALTDLEREFQLARSKPRYLAPQPKTSAAPVRAGLDGLIDFLIAAQHIMEMFRRSLPNGHARNRVLRLSKRLFKILAEIRNLRTT